MRRRQFISFVGNASAASLLPSLSVRAQQPERPLVAVIFSGSADGFASRTAAFRKGLGETGYADGKNVTIEYHGLDGHYEQLPALLDDLIRRHVTVIATPGSGPAALAAKAAGVTVPLVFGVAEDPVVLGLVASLAHPGGNATGINFFAHETNAKRLGLMHELLPQASRFAVLINPTNVNSVRNTMKEVDEAAAAFGLKILFLNATNSREIEDAFAAIAREKYEALFIASDGFFAGQQTQFAMLAARDRIPVSCSARHMAEAGLLMSYGTSVTDMFRQVGIYTGSILKGTKPADLPVLQSTRFEFVINLQTARSLGLDIPPMLLARADEVLD
jgi:putative tryptophan/tyrosine transport system substrate-binding protein